MTDEKRKVGLGSINIIYRVGMQYLSLDRLVPSQDDRLFDTASTNRPGVRATQMREANHDG
jgi:hypothetical protein